VEGYEMTALITGASSGIGLELARIFASNRYDVVLVARNETKLRELARECESSGVRAHVIAADLSKADAARFIVEGVARLGLEIDVLVNNAGYGLLGPFVETPLVTELEMIQVNITALTELTKRVLPGMVTRRRGRILNLASTAAFVPGPLMAVYYATKAYVLSFSEAIANELEGSGVTVTALCPGPTASGFQAAARLEGTRLFTGNSLPSSRDVAQAGYAALMEGTVVYVPGVANKLTAMSARFAPRAVIRRIVRRMQERR
jgi:short-subunit dehydrogenase